MGITNQQKQFIDEFIKQGRINQKQAAIKAGYSEKTADSQASQLLKNPKVAAYLQERVIQIESEIRKNFIFYALEGIKENLKILKNPDAKDSDKISIAKDFMDRAGFKGVEKQQIDITILKALEEWLDE